MATSYSIISDPENRLVLNGPQVKLKARLAAGTSYEAIVERDVDGTKKRYALKIDGTSLVREISKRPAGLNAVVPQSYFDFVAVDSKDPNQHPAIGPFTHVAVKNGLWSDPTIWNTGTLPGELAVVNVGDFEVTYDVESAVRIKDIHVSGPGILRWATNIDTLLVVDTVMCNGTLILGEANDPIGESTTAGKPRARIWHWASEAPLATVRLGVNTMGAVRMHGAEKDHWLRAPSSIPAGATSASLENVATSGWRVGDTILFAATEDAGISPTDATYKGPMQFYGPLGNPAGVRTPTMGFKLSQDEERVITSIVGDVISWSTPLTYSHKLYSGTLPRGQVVTLKPYVANKSRSIEFRTLGGRAGDADIWPEADLTNLQKRAHMMFMFSDDIQIRNVRALDMARTDTNPSLVAPTAKVDLDLATETNFVAYNKPPTDATRVPITDQNNVRGRYAFHFHGTGAYWGRQQVALEGCVADTSPGAPPIPGWAITHHNSRASIVGCVVHNVRGSGMVSEVGNEIGQWIDNLVCHARGDGYPMAFGSRAEWWQNHNDHYGSGFGNQARQILMQGNHATSSHKAYSYLQQDVAASIRQPDEFSLRMIDPIVRSISSYPFPIMNPEQPQIPDFIDNTFAGCGDGLYVEHRLNKLDRRDETPMLLHGFHGVNTRTPFNIVNYTQHYYVFDSLWDGFTTGANIGSVAASFNFANMLLKNGSLGLNPGNNYGGFITDVETENVTTPFGNSTLAISTSNDDPTQHKYYNMMDEWVVTNNDSPSPGYTVRVRTGRSLNSQIDLPQPYPKPPLGQYMPEGSPPVPYGSTPYFLLDEATSDLTIAANGGFDQITINGTLRDCVGDRRFGDYQNPETPFANYAVTIGRKTNGVNGEDVVRRNGCFNDNGVWKSRLWFIYADRATGEYYFPQVDVTLTGFSNDFLSLYTVDPNSTKPVLPLKPEASRVSRYKKPAIAPVITSTSSIVSTIGLPLAHILKANTGQVKWSLMGGYDENEFEITSFNGVTTLRFVDNAVKPTSGSFSLMVRATDPVGNYVDVLHTVNVIAEFSDNFAGANGQPLENRPGWSLLYGSAAAGSIVSNSLKRNGTGGYQSIDLGSVNQGVSCRFLSSNSSGSVALRFTDAKNFISVGRNGNQLEASAFVAGAHNFLAVYSPPNFSSIDVVSIEVVGRILTVRVNGVVIPRNYGADIPTSLPESTRQGFKFTAALGDGWLDDYRAYAL